MYTGEGCLEADLSVAQKQLNNNSILTLNIFDLKYNVYICVDANEFI